MDEDATPYRVRIDQAATQVRDFVAGCPEAVWTQPVPGDGRTVGVVSHHIAAGIGLGAGWLLSVRTGVPLAGALTFEQNDERNRRDATRWAAVRPAQVLELLDGASASLQEEIAQVDAPSLDEQRSRNEMFGRRWTPRGLIDVTLSHTQGHLSELQAMVPEPAPGR